MTARLAFRAALAQIAKQLGHYSEDAENGAVFASHEGPTGDSDALMLMAWGDGAQEIRGVLERAGIGPYGPKSKAQNDGRFN